MRVVAPSLRDYVPLHTYAAKIQPGAVDTSSHPSHLLISCTEYPVPNAFAGDICLTSRLGEIPSQP
jgi:hypothetical protein